MKIIVINKICSVLVDDDSFKKIDHYKWYLTSKGYAAASISIGGKRKTLRMHRLITGAPKGMEVDHKNGNKLDNRKSNLRICTVSQNQMNRTGLNKNNRSGFRGVWWSTKLKRWTARVRKDRKFYHCGFFDIKEEAAKAYNNKAMDLFGEYASLNIV